MEPTQKLIDDIYRERVLRARRTPPIQRLVDGPQLFAEACERIRLGVIHQYSDATPERVEEIVHARLDRVRRLEEHGLYHQVQNA